MGPTIWLHNIPVNSFSCWHFWWRKFVTRTYIFYAVSIRNQTLTHQTTFFHQCHLNLIHVISSVWKSESGYRCLFTTEAMSSVSFLFGIDFFPAPLALASSSCLQFFDQFPEMFSSHRTIRKSGCMHPFCLITFTASLDVSRDCYCFHSNDLAWTILENLKEIKWKEFAISPVTAVKPTQYPLLLRQHGVRSSLHSRLHEKS